MPLPREVSYLISYFVYFVELSLSLVLLFRVVGLAPLEAIICAQLYLLILFPPTNGSFVTLQWYSLAPVNAHLVTICNVLLVLILITGRYRIWINLICSVGVFFLLACGIFSAPVTFLTYAPVYAVAGVALLLGAKPNTKELGWKLAAVLAAGVVLWLVGLHGLFARDQPDLGPGDDLSGGISGRPRPFDVALLAGRVGEIRRLCATLFPVPALSEFLYLYWFVPGSRPLRLSTHDAQTACSRHAAFFCVCLRVRFCGSISLFGSAHAISTPFLVWSSFPFTVLFLGLLIFRIARTHRNAVAGVLASVATQRAAESWTGEISRGGNDPRHSSSCFGELAAANTLFQPPPPAHNPRIPLLGPSSIRHAEIGAITRYLIDHASHRARRAVSRIYRDLPGGAAGAGDAAAAAGRAALSH